MCAGSNSEMKRCEEWRGSRKGQWEGGDGGDGVANRGSVKRGGRIRQAVHISWLPLIIRAFPWWGSVGLMTSRKWTCRTQPTYTHPCWATQPLHSFLKSCSQSTAVELLPLIPTAHLLLIGVPHLVPFYCSCYSVTFTSTDSNETIMNVPGNFNGCRIYEWEKKKTDRLFSCLDCFKF